MADTFALAGQDQASTPESDFGVGHPAAPVPWYTAVGDSFDNGVANQQLGAREHALDTAFFQRQQDIQRRTGQDIAAPTTLSFGVGSEDTNPTMSALDAGPVAGTPDTQAAYEAKVDALRQKYPAQMAGVPTADQVRQGVDDQLNTYAAKAAVGAQQHPVASFVGGGLAQFTDPVNVAAGVATGELGAGLPLIGRVLLQSPVWGGLAALEAPAKALEAKSFGGPEYTAQDALSDIAGGAVSGPLFELGGFAFHKLASAAADSLAPGFKRLFAGDPAGRGALDAGEQFSRDAAATGVARSGGDFEAGLSSLAGDGTLPSILPDQDLGDLFGTPAPVDPLVREATPTYAAPAGASLFEASEYRGRPIYAGTFDPKALSTAPEVFQYKAGGDAQGVTDRLRGVQAWDPTSSGKVLTYQTQDGGLFIADGHQRLGLANRMDAAGFEPRLDGYLFKESDGWTPRDVRTIAALKNIREGQGSPLDAAKVFRDNPQAMSDDSLPVSGDFINQAKGLGRLSPDAFGAVVNKVIPERYGAQIGQLAGDRPDLHSGLVRLLKAGDPASLDEAHALIHEALEDDWVSGQGEQSDLFGDTPAQSVAIARAKLRAWLVKSVRSDSRLFSQLVKHADAIEAGGNTLARNSNEAQLALNNTALTMISKLGMRGGELGDAMGEAAGKIAGGGRVAEAGKAILGKLKRALANGEKIDLARSELLDPAKPLPGAESHLEAFSEPGGEGQKAQITPKPEDAHIENAPPPGAEGEAPPEALHPGLFDDLPDATRELNARDHLLSCVPGE